MKTTRRNLIVPTLLILYSAIIFTGCETELLNLNPLDQISTETFWMTEDDAMLGLVGVYNSNTENHQTSWSFYGMNAIYRIGDLTTDNGYEKDAYLTDFNSGLMTSANPIINQLWKSSYTAIARCNNFLDNIGNVKMGDAKKAELTAEVKFIRAYYYFYMSQYWGGVPLLKNSISIQDANNISRNSKQEIVDFVMDELSACAIDLPVSRPASEQGRILKAAALAIKGRLQMSEKKWTDAVKTYKSVIEMGVFEIDPRFKELFIESNGGSKEFILCVKYLENEYKNMHQRLLLPFMFGGWHQVGPYNNLVKDFECTDGLPIDQSPLYNPDTPYLNRDPRLYTTIFLPEFTIFRDRLYVAHPDSSPSKYPDNLLRRDFSGYALKKFVDEDFKGDVANYGGDYPVIRYSEILLSYLESKLENGDAINQELLDQTINQVRGRQSVRMPYVTETDPAKLRTILRRERRVELAFEGLRLFDLFRWRTAHILLNGSMYGMKLTTDPLNYTKFKIDSEGYFFVEETHFRENVDYLFPIPQREIDINPNLDQNPGY